MVVPYQRAATASIAALQLSRAHHSLAMGAIGLHIGSPGEETNIHAL
jgi:hypothetical protein